MHAYRVGEAHGDAERIKADTMYSSLTFLIGTIGGVIMGPLLLSLGFSVPLLLAGGAGLNTVVAVYVGLLMFVSEPEEEGGPEASGAKKLSYRAAADAEEERAAKPRKYSACTIDVLSILFADAILQFTASAYNVSSNHESNHSKQISRSFFVVVGIFILCMCVCVISAPQRQKQHRQQRSGDCAANQSLHKCYIHQSQHMSSRVPPERTPPAKLAAQAMPLAPAA